MRDVTTGGSAFPLYSPDQPGPYPRPWSQEGMSLRDWFAGQSMIGMLASPALMEFVTSKAEGGEGVPFSRLARKAYEQADALIAERDK